MTNINSFQVKIGCIIYLFYSCVASTCISAVSSLRKVNT